MTSSSICLVNDIATFLVGFLIVIIAVDRVCDF